MEKYITDRILDMQPLPAPEAGIDLFIVTYASQGLRVKGYLMLPAGRGSDDSQARDAAGVIRAEQSELYPGLLYCRGGIRRVGMVRVERIAMFCRLGYAVFAPFYRGNEGGEGREDFGGEDRYDVYEALAALRSLPFIAPRPIPLVGFSRGGMMALLAAKECPLAGPAVVWGGVSDLLLTYEERIDLRRMLKRVVGHPRKQQEAYIRRSPVYWADQIRRPVFMIHGTEDVQVSVGHARLLAEALEQHGKPYRLQLFEGIGHVFPPHANELAMQLIDRWIKEHTSV